MDSQDRSGQNNAIIYQCLRASLSTKALSKLDKRSNEFIINGVPSALCFLKVCVQAACLDTNKSATAARKALMKLELMVEDVVDFNINDFVEEVNNLLEILGAFDREYNDQDLMINTIEAFRKVPDDRFQRWVDRREDELNEGITKSEKLLTAAKTECEARMLNEDWCKPNERGAQIMALDTKLEDLSLKLKKGSRPRGSNDKESDKQSPMRHPKECETWGPPKEGESKIRFIKSKRGQKPIHWCPKHQRWVVHKTEDCHLVVEPKESMVDRSKKSEKNDVIESKAALAVSEMDTSDNDSDGSDF